jgi:hypothetical protein
MSKRTRRTRRHRCNLCNRFLCPDGYCIECVQEKREFAGWSGSLSYGSRRVTPIPNV